MVRFNSSIYLTVKQAVYNCEAITMWVLVCLALTAEITAYKSSAAVLLSIKYVGV